MTLNEFKSTLERVEKVRFKLPNGSFVPKHYHLTEVGLLTKHFIDCGGTMREEKAISLQLWYAGDINHRLKPQKFIDILTLSEEQLRLTDAPIEVEYQSETIGKYGLDFDGKYFVLTAKSTDCLARDACNVPIVEELSTLSTCCSPNSGCC